MEVDGPLIFIDEDDIPTLQSYLLTEAKGLHTLDTEKSGIIQKALSKIVRAGQKVAGWLGSKFKKGRKAATSAANRRLKKIQKDFKSDAKEIVKRYLNAKDAGNKPSYKRFRKTLRNKLRKAHTEAFYLGLASSGQKTFTTTRKLQVSKAHREWLETAIKEELAYFQKLLDGIKSGKVSKKRAESRLDNYTAAMRHVYYTGRTLGTPDGMAVDWVTAQDRKVCQSCSFLAKHSPYTKHTLPTTPRAGMTRCLANCRCRLVMREVSPETYKKIQNKHRSKQWYHRRLQALKSRKSLHP